MRVTCDLWHMSIYAMMDVLIGMITFEVDPRKLQIINMTLGGLERTVGKGEAAALHVLLVEREQRLREVVRLRHKCGEVLRHVPLAYPCALSSTASDCVPLDPRQCCICNSDRPAAAAYMAHALSHCTLT